MRPIAQQEPHSTPIFSIRFRVTLLTLLFFCLACPLVKAELKSVSWDHTARAELDRSELPTHPGAFNGCFIDPSDDYVPPNWDGNWSYPTDGLNCAVESNHSGELTTEQLDNPWHFATQTLAQADSRPGTRGVESEAKTELRFSQGPPSVYHPTDINITQGSLASSGYWLRSEDMAGAAAHDASSEVVFTTSPDFEYIGPTVMSVRIEMEQDESLTEGISGTFEVFDLTADEIVFYHECENIPSLEEYRDPIDQQIPFEELIGHDIRLRFSSSASVFKEADDRYATHLYRVHTRVTGLQVVPEPSSGSLLSVASFFMLAFSRRTRKSTQVRARRTTTRTRIVRRRKVLNR